MIWFGRLPPPGWPPVRLYATCCHPIYIAVVLMPLRHGCPSCGPRSARMLDSPRPPARAALGPVPVSSCRKSSSPLATGGCYRPPMPCPPRELHESLRLGRFSGLGQCSTSIEHDRPSMFAFSPPPGLMASEARGGSVLAAFRRPWETCYN
jgi:hypothetical protein